MTFPSINDGLLKLPLGSLTAVVLDTETTGLDPVKSRIIELGAVRIDAGRICHDDACSVLVNPGVPIPAASSKIHGISDDDVKNAEEFPAGMAKFIEWAGPCLIIGYSIGFDISMLKAEHERHDINWTQPRAIDVQELVDLLGIDLPDFSLDTVAAYLGVEVVGRHRAVSDAVLTAAVFLELVPRLRAAGIQSFAEAERACAAKRSRHSEASVNVPRDLSHAHVELRASSGPYRQRVTDVMRSPPVSVSPRTTLAESVAVMVREKIGSLVVEEGNGNPAGIFTERDLVRALGTHGESVLQHPVDRHCSRPFDCVSVKEFLYRAMGTMDRKSIRHLGVRNLDGELVGIVSARDVFVGQAVDFVDFGRRIDVSETPSELGQVWAGLNAVANALVSEGVDARTVAAVISRELRGLTKRAAALANAEVIEAHGPPPSDFAVMILGSGGRGESLLAMDQDNAIVFSEGQAGGQADTWCQRLGARMSDILDQTGVSYCSGGVMASNQEWRMDVASWRQKIAKWMALSRPEDLLSADIFFDSMAVFGDERLVDGLRNDAISEVAEHKPFLRLLADRAADTPSPFGWLGRPKLQRNRLDLKMHGLMPIFSAARVCALKHGIQSRSTANRLKRVRELGTCPEKLVNDLDSAHRILLGAILKQQLQDIANGVPPSNSVAYGDLDGLSQEQIVWALKHVPSVADLMEVPARL